MSKPLLDFLGALRPTPSKGHHDFKHLVSDVLREYKNSILKLGSPDGVAIRPKLINSLCDALDRTISLSLNGQVVASLDSFKEAWEAIKEIFPRGGRGEIKTPPGELSSTREIPHLYRMRKSESELTSPHELFHVPFEERRKVSSCRFSALGVPCLYLSGSVRMCWEELRRPPLEMCYVSKFTVKRPLSMLDLTYRAGRVIQLVQAVNFQSDNAEVVRLYLESWPLIFACTVQRFDRDSPYAPEYIIPNTLMAFMLEHNIYDAVAFSSSRGARNIRENPSDSRIQHSNVAFPVRDIRDSGFSSELNKLFEVSVPECVELHYDQMWEHQILDEFQKKI